MVNIFQSTFQATYNKRDIGFKDPKSTTLEEHFVNLNIHDQTFDADDVGLYLLLLVLPHLIILYLVIYLIHIILAWSFLLT